MEANPGTIKPDELCQLRAIGVSRLSLGVQSAHTRELGLLGRIHTWRQAIDTVTAVRAAGFDNLNPDFMFGLPGQTLAHWKKSVGSHPAEAGARPSVPLRAFNRRGIDETRFYGRFGQTLEATFGKQLYQLRDAGLVERNARAPRLAQRGRLLGNQVFMQFV